MSTRIPELLSPAGDRERLEAAVRFGADAVYLGGSSFGMRASPANFSQEQLAVAVQYCHSHGVRVYLACNTLPTNADAEQLPGFLRGAGQAGVDALIIADLGVFREARRILPGMELHVSTQAGVVNYLAAREWHAMGASRVVLARELSLDDIARIRDKTPPELQIEAFVHGAMCMSFSGRCLISQYLTGRDANHGECAQPCRWGYHLVEEKRPGQYFPVFEDERGSFILNAQDLCMLPYIDRLAAAGVGSLKIEGRAKSAYYVSVVTNAYRMALELYRENPTGYCPPDWLLEELHTVSHRQYSTGFYLQEHPPAQYYQSGGYVRLWDVVAVAVDWQDGVLRCSERTRFGTGEELEVVAPGKKPFPLVVEWMKDEEGNVLEVARHPMMELVLPCPVQVPQGALLRRKRPEPPTI